MAHFSRTWKPKPTEHRKNLGDEATRATRNGKAQGTAGNQKGSLILPTSQKTNRLTTTSAPPRPGAKWVWKMARAQERWLVISGKGYLKGVFLKWKPNDARIILPHNANANTVHLHDPPLAVSTLGQWLAARLLHVHSSPYLSRSADSLPESARSTRPFCG